MKEFRRGRTQLSLAIEASVAIASKFHKQCEVKQLFSKLNKSKDKQLKWNHKLRFLIDVVFCVVKWAH